VNAIRSDGPIIAGCTDLLVSSTQKGPLNEALFIYTILRERSAW